MESGLLFVIDYYLRLRRYWNCLASEMVDGFLTRIPIFGRWLSKIQISYSICLLRYPFGWKCLTMIVYVSTVRDGWSFWLVVRTAFYWCCFLLFLVGHRLIGLTSLLVSCGLIWTRYLYSVIQFSLCVYVVPLLLWMTNRAIFMLVHRQSAKLRRILRCLLLPNRYLNTKLILLNLRDLLWDPYRQHSKVSGRFFFRLS